MLLPYDETVSVFGKYDLELTEKQYIHLNKYSDMLVEWNEKINLTAITDPEGITVKHMLDSLLIFKYAEIKPGSSYIDVGTGAGFPGIPIKIYDNSLDCFLLDSLNKRVNFLNEVSTALELPMTAIHSRAEDGGHKPELREKFDISVARAVAALPVLCEYCMPYVKIGGVFIAMKGPNENYKDSYTAYKTMGGEISSVKEYTLLNDEKRQIIVIKKIKETPSKYPRNPSQISKKPL
ncbi:MAG: 16S rRNA (guanine(527)-N(7))-methyltransferase RsmG [Huintestinicola sp.]